MMYRPFLTLALIYSICSVLVAGLNLQAPDQQGKPKRKYQRSENNTTTLQGYEYVIVGSGPGGGPLAARLAIAGHKVLLLEAGDDNGADINQQVPALHLQSTEDVAQRWDYFVNHYPDAARQKKDSKLTWTTPSGGSYVGLNPPAGSKVKGIYYPRAGTLGGCGSHNALVTTYPHESDWSNIARITGDDSWAPAAMRKYFERMERCEYLPNGTAGHGFNGWFGVSQTDFGPISKDLKVISMVEAAATLMGKGVPGLPANLTGLAATLNVDINADNHGRSAPEGLYPIPIAVSNYKRNGPREFVLAVANAVKADGSKKYHLDIRLNCLVTRVRFSPKGAGGKKPKAIGVDFLDGKSLYRADPRSSAYSGGAPGSVDASREVILAAGTFNTPQLLKLSGIGPKAELENFRVPVVVDLPGVGTNLQDRYETGIVAKTDSDFTLTAGCTFNKPGQPDPCLAQYENNSTDHGLYTSNGFAIGAVKKSTVAVGEPDLILVGGPANFKGYFQGYSDLAFRDARHWVWLVLKAHSRNTQGTVGLRSADPRDTPQVNFNSFGAGSTAGGADQLDLQAAAEGVALARKIYADLVPLAGSFTEVWPGPDVSSTAQVKDFIQNEAWGHHASCTCPIGADDNPKAVLDSKFRVRGVDNLRVVDASAFPAIPGFFIAVPVYMLSEKAADVILHDL